MRALLAAGLMALALAGCAGGQDELPPFIPDYPDSRYPERQSTGRLTGEGGFQIFGGSRSESPGAGGGGGIGVNAYLWQATLTTFADVAPLASADPFGGVVIYDWFTAPGAPDEQFKISVYILGRELRADGLKVAVFRQVRDTSGHWVGAEVSPKTRTDFENLILVTARQLRVRSAPQ